MKFETLFPEATRLCRDVLTTMEKVNYDVHGLKSLSICKEMLRQLKRVSPSVRSNLIDTTRISAP